MMCVEAVTSLGRFDFRSNTDGNNTKAVLLAVRYVLSVGAYLENWVCLFKILGHSVRLLRFLLLRFSLRTRTSLDTFYV